MISSFEGESMDPVPDPPPLRNALDVRPRRRSFLGWLTYGLGAIAMAVVGIPFVGYLVGARKAPVKWVPLGPVTQFPQDQTRLVTFDNPIRQAWDGMAAHTGVYVRYQGRDEHEADETKSHKFLVLAVNCAHLGCPVEWFQESGLFMCPCHGGVYYADGERASGPPPRGLYHCVARVSRAGETLQLEIQAPHFPTRHDTLDQVG
jgi:Rieske Fe-S protein